MTAVNRTRRAVMNSAWGFKRSEPSASFSICMVRLWAFVKPMIEAGRRFAQRTPGAGHVRLSPSLNRSPIANVSGKSRAGRYADFKAARTAAFVGG